MDRALKRFAREDGLLIGIFLLSRLFYRFILKMEFDMSSLQWAWQLLDPSWLKDDPLRSIWYLHMQPPLFNLLTALALHLPPFFLDSLFLTFGLLTTYLLHRLGLQLGLSRLLSFALVLIAFVLNPASILYETWYFYTYPVLFLTVLLTFLLVRSVRKPTFFNLLLALSTLTLLTLLRSSYHLILFLLMGCSLACYLRRKWKEVVLASIFASSPTLFWYTKNWVLFGVFSSTSWTGMNISRLVWNMPGWDEERFKKLHTENVVSSLMTVPPFSPPWIYDSLLNYTEGTGVEFLDSFIEPTTGGVNYNHIVYPTVSRILLKDNFTLFLHHPYIYFRALLSSVKMFTYPPYAYPFVGRFHELFRYDNFNKFIKLKGLILFYNILYGWPSEKLPGMAILLVLLIFLLLLPVMLRRADTGIVAALILYLTAVHVLFERRENMRFRFQFEPVMLVLVLSSTVRTRKGLKNA